MALSFQGTIVNFLFIWWKLSESESNVEAFKHHFSPRIFFVTILRRIVIHISRDVRYLIWSFFFLMFQCFQEGWFIKRYFTQSKIRCWIVRLIQWPLIRKSLFNGRRWRISLRYVCKHCQCLESFFSPDIESTLNVHRHRAPVEQWRTNERQDDRVDKVTRKSREVAQSSGWMLAEAISSRETRVKISPHPIWSFSIGSLFESKLHSISSESLSLNFL